MSIVLDEHQWAEDAINNNNMGKKPFETLSRVARYYIDEGYSKEETRALLDNYLLRCDPNVSLPKWANTLDHALGRALKYQAIVIDSIKITETEIKTISSIPGRIEQRLAFTLLCLSKYWNYINPNMNCWVCNPDSEIMKLANIEIGTRKQCSLYHTLWELGLIQFSKNVGNTTVRVLFLDDNTENIALEINDFRNLGYQYQNFRGNFAGKQYFQCAECGLIDKYKDSKRGLKQKYCRSCAVKVQTRQKVNYVMKQRLVN